MSGSGAGSSNDPAPPKAVMPLSPAPAAAVDLPSEVEEPDAEAAEIAPETFGPEPRPAGYETPPEFVGSDLD